VDTGSVEWSVYRVWLSGKASLTEIEDRWSLDDLVNANEALDVQAELEAAAADAVKSK